MTLSGIDNGKCGGLSGFWQKIYTPLNPVMIHVVIPIQWKKQAAITQVVEKIAAAATHATLETENR